MEVSESRFLEAKLSRVAVRHLAQMCQGTAGQGQSPRSLIQSLRRQKAALLGPSQGRDFIS